MASPNDYKSAETTYSAFIAALKWVVPVVGLIALIVVILIAS